jgi:hypothetical protein
LDELTPDLVDELIERIEIFDASHIKVRVKYMDEYQRLIQQMSE